MEQAKHTRSVSFARVLDATKIVYFRSDQQRKMIDAIFDLGIVDSAYILIKNMLGSNIETVVRI